MNTALIIHLLTQVQHLIHGHHFHPVIVPECFQWARVRDPQTGRIARRLVCGLIKFGPHFASVTWR